MRLSAPKFEYYHCAKKTVIGVNMMNMFKLIKTMGNNDTLTLFIEKDNPNKLGIRINNVDKKSQTTFKLNLLDISDEDIVIPPAKFETELTLPSADFQKLVRDMTNIGVNIDSIINLSIFKFLKKLNNKMKYVNTSKICIINIESLKFVLRK